MFAIDIVLALFAICAVYLFGHRRGYLLHRRVVERRLQEVSNEAGADESLARAVRRLRMRLYWSGSRRLLGPPGR